MTSPTTYKLGFPKLKYPTVPMASGAPFQRAPTTADVNDPKVGSFYKIGTMWPNVATNTIYMLTNLTAGVATWQALTGAASAVLGPAVTVDNTIPRFDGTTGKLLQTSAVTMADTTGAMTFPSGGGTILTAGAGAAERKGTFVLASGTHAKIATTAAVTGSVIVYTIAALGTVTAPSALSLTIDNGVGFTPLASQLTDTSTINWAIVA